MFYLSVWINELSWCMYYIEGPWDQQPHTWVCQSQKDSQTCCSWWHSNKGILLCKQCNIIGWDSTYTKTKLYSQVQPIQQHKKKNTISLQMSLNTFMSCSKPYKTMSNKIILHNSIFSVLKSRKDNNSFWKHFLNLFTPGLNHKHNLNL
jgi:hypothetical protein